MSSTSNPSTSVNSGCISICDPNTGVFAPVTSDGLKVKIDGDIDVGTVTVELDHTDDTVQVYGSDLTGPIKTDATGQLFIGNLPGTSGQLAVNVITGFATSTLQGAGLPAALSAGSNLKVSIEEGNISGFATSGNQLADGHAVTIDNANDNEVFIAGGATQTNNVKIEGGVHLESSSGSNLWVEQANDDTDPNLDTRVMLGTHSLLSARKDDTTTIGLTALDGAGGSINALHVAVSDGTNTMPTMDVAGRAGFTKITDGTNTMPTMDDASRAGHVTVTNPTSVFDGAISHDALDELGTAINASDQLEVSINNIDGSAGTMITANARHGEAENKKVSIGDSTTEIVISVPSRYELTIVNDSDEVIYLGLDEDAVLNEGVRLNPNGGSFSTDVFTGPVDGICASGASGNVTVLEIV